jgi:DNA-binding NtrC family response regulator
MTRLLLFSRDVNLQRFLGSAVTEFTVLVESSKSKLIDLAHHEEVDVVLLDLNARYFTVEEQVAVLDAIRDAGIPAIITTDDVTRPTALDMETPDDLRWLRKPLSIPELTAMVRSAHEHTIAKKELWTGPQQADSCRCDSLIGGSSRSLGVYDLIRRVRNLDAFVLITGESGTGKELVARAIHNLSHRADHPFVAVSCGAIPETLIEAELFGHEKGAFTGTNGAREGYMEKVGNGTLLLDEIGELSLPTQVKLLRVLQQREFSRLGSNRLIPLRARVLFATHRELATMVSEGTFRRDLFYRVNVMRIQVPSLRERPEDIGALADHFLQKYASAYHKEIREIDSGAKRLLVEYDWPGNIRELENVIQGAVIMCESGSIGPEDLPESIQQLDVAGIAAPSIAGSFEDLLREYKVLLANKAIRECNGNKTLAARNLQISRAYLHRLIRTTPESEYRDNNDRQLVR